MEKRVLAAVSLSFLVLFLYQTFVVKPKPRVPVPGASTSAPATPGDTALTAGASATGDAASTPAAQPVEAPASLVSSTTDQDIIVDTEWVRARFSNRGAVLRSWALKHYLDSKGHPIDIIPSPIKDPALAPFAISTNDPTLTARMQSALYRPSTDKLTLGATSGTLAFEFQDAAGLKVRKEFVFQPDRKPYVIRVNITATNNGEVLKLTYHGGAGVGDTERGVKPSGFFATSMYQPPEAIFEKDSTVVRAHYANLSQHAVEEGRFRYVGVDDHYFLAALLPGDRNVRVEYKPISLLTEYGPRELVDFRARVGGQPGPVSFFYGPKDFDILAGVDQELVRAIHFGWFAFLAVPLLRSLKWLNAYIHNYGWSIITLTVLINLAMFPLRHKSVVSMRKMQEIQPQVKAIQDRYAKLKVSDPARQKMNTELMGLYRERGVNPASGCIPMLLTMPVLFAFYALLSVAIELRGAPFAGWIHDLSSYDPLYVTPVLMGLAQFWQTKIMPTAADPAQQRVMMIMPLMFMVFFLWAPSGLVIYWLVSNMWTIGQQYFTNYMLGPPPQHNVRPPAERRVKRVEAAAR